MTGTQMAATRDSLLQMPWRLWGRQVRSIVALESKRNLLSWRAMWVYFLAFAPTVIIFIHTVFDRSRPSLPDDSMVLAGIFQFYYLRLGIFFGCLGIFTRLIRGEMVERSLHYYLLAPVRRELLLLGKFAAGTVRSLLLFESGVFLSFFLIYVRLGTAGEQFVFDGAGMSHLIAYMGITALACVGYGSIFLLLSMLMKNPAPAALVLMLWEFISSILPAFLQRFGVASNLRHLLPITVPGEGIFALLTVNTEPVSAWTATLGVLLLTAVVLAISCYRIRSLEISYTTE